MQLSKRIEWVDIYKGLAIILVVLGHATGLFNVYIYQFHVAAFFFISGWVAKYNGTNLLAEIYKKTMTLLLPLLTMVIIFGVLTSVLKLCGVYKYFWEEESYQTIINQIYVFLSNHTTIDLLGASWFLITLFSASIISHLIYKMTFDNNLFFILLTAVLYFIGYKCMKDGNSIGFINNRAFIAQGFYGLGYFLKTELPDISLKKDKKGIAISWSLVIIASASLHIMKVSLGGKNLSDIANGQMNSFLWTAVASLVGIVWLYAVSQCISLTRFTIVKESIISLGKNTLGIMFLHFFFFRLSACVLFLLGLVDINELSHNVPSPTVGNTYWILYVLLSITGAYLTWKCFIKTQILMQVLGADKEFINRIYMSKPIVGLSKSIKQVVSAIKIAVFHSKKDKEKRDLIIILMYMIALALVVSVRFIPNTHTENYEEINTELVSGPVTVTFPYYGTEIEFGEGWLEQAEGEGYRWVQKDSSFICSLSDQTIIRMRGYVPADIPVTRADLYLNDIWVSGCDINGEQEIVFEANIADKVSELDSVFHLIFDGERNIDGNSQDKRVFSAMFTSIEIE